MTVAVLVTSVVAVHYTVTLLVIRNTLPPVFTLVVKEHKESRLL